jgi:two-component system chemotaxis response regulator CheB
MTEPIRVLVVDDSAFARKVLREILSTSPRILVVDIARDGLEALEKIEELKPDVVTLDLVMPHLDGIGVLQALSQARSAGGGPRVVIVSISDADSDLGVRALESGAVDLVQKPTALATDRLYEMSMELIHAVEVAHSARPAPAPSPRRALEAHASSASVRVAREGVLVIGASTGGPQAITRLLTSLPPDFPLPIALVVHIPIGYTEALARRLNHVCALTVVEASEGLGLTPGLVVVARAGMHLRLERRGGAAAEARLEARLDMQPLTTPHRPAVDVLFQSAASALGASVVGVVLTGMGDDGLEGSRAIRAAGGRVLTEAESSCVIYGMPRCVREAGLSNVEAPLDALPDEIMRMLR